MIRHTVVFKLKHPAGSQEEADFLKAARKLSEISVVNKFESLRQVSQKNNFSFGLSMKFQSQADYDPYNADPHHNQFVQNIWLPQVVEFLEIDYVPLELEAWST